MHNYIQYTSKNSGFDPTVVLTVVLTQLHPQMSDSAVIKLQPPSTISLSNFTRILIIYIITKCKLYHCTAFYIHISIPKVIRIHTVHSAKAIHTV